MENSSFKLIFSCFGGLGATAPAHKYFLLQMLAIFFSIIMSLPRVTVLIKYFQLCTLPGQMVTHFLLADQNLLSIYH